MLLGVDCELGRIYDVFGIPLLYVVSIGIFGGHDNLRYVEIEDHQHGSAFSDECY